MDQRFQILILLNFYEQDQHYFLFSLLINITVLSNVFITFMENKESLNCLYLQLYVICIDIFVYSQLDDFSVWVHSMQWSHNDIIAKPMFLSNPGAVLVCLKMVHNLKVINNVQHIILYPCSLIIISTILSCSCTHKFWNWYFLLFIGLIIIFLNLLQLHQIFEIKIQIYYLY